MMTTMDALYAMPGHLIRRAQQMSTALFAEECGAELTSVQYAAMVAIEAHPDLDATRLSVLVAFDRSTLGNVLGRLEARGWVERRPSPADRRVKRLHLSPEGRRVLHAATPAVLRVQDRLLAPLAAAEREVLVGLLARLA